MVLTLFVLVGCPDSGDDDSAMTDDDHAADDDSGGDDDTAGDEDGDGVSSEDGDCDDTDPAVYPGATEICDGRDNDCDGVVDGFEPQDCPDPGSMELHEGQGLLAAAEQAFALVDEDGWATSFALLDQLQGALDVTPIAEVLDDANRTGVRADSGDVSRVDHFVSGFRWNDGDVDVDYWYPQGITGSFDADESGVVDGRRVVLVSWHYDEADAGTAYDKGIRISFADITDLDDVRYRHVLLVEPFDNGGVPDFREVPVHAGGIVWLGERLYVADTSWGLRVFDMARILEVDTTVDAMGWDGVGSYHAYQYRYVLPQVTRYTLADCSCSARFSFVALDRTSAPASLVSGNYINDSIAGMLYRWPLDEATGLLRGMVASGPTPATEAWAAQHDRMQGALSNHGEWWLSCSSQAGQYGQLYRTADSTPSEAFDWVDGPEDLAWDPTTDELWSASEDPGDRWVFSVRLGEY